MTPAERLYHKGAEQSALGSVLVDNETVWTLPESADFYNEGHQAIADAIRSLSGRSGLIDIITVSDELERLGKSNAAIGPAYLAELMNNTPTALYAEHYANIVKRRGMLKRFFHLIIEAQKRFWQGDDPDVLFIWLRDELERLLTGTQSTTDRSRTTVAATFDALGRYEERKRRNAEGVPPGWDTPWPALNKFLPYIEPNGLIVAYGEGGVGKTVMAYQWHEYYQRCGYDGVYYQNEMSDEAIDNIRMVRLSGVPLDVIRNGSGTEEQENRLTQVAQEVSTWPGTGYMVNAAGMSVDDIAVDIERRRKQDGIQYFMLDHMKMLLDTPSDRQRQAKYNETQLFGDNIRRLNGVCNRLGLRGLVLHHPNKEGSLYSSTDIQNLVDCVIHLEAQTANFAEKYPGSERVIARHGDLSWWLKFSIQKNRFGPPGKNYLFFERPLFRISTNPAHQRTSYDLNGDHDE